MTNDPTAIAAQSWQARLYVERSRELLLLGRAMGLNPAESEDVLQDTFASLLQRTPPPEDPHHFSVGVFRNKARNYKRSLWRRLWRETRFSEIWFETDASTPPEELEAMKALSQLPAKQRETVILKIWHGYTFEQIATLLDISPHTVAGRYRYAMEKLRTDIHLYETHPQRQHPTGEPLPFLETHNTLQKPL